MHKKALCNVNSLRDPTFTLDFYDFNPFLINRHIFIYYIYLRASEIDFLSRNPSIDAKLTYEI